MEDMKGKIREFSPGAIQHIYQRAIDRGVIFYTVEDRLVYYTLAAVNSKKHGVRVYSASIMFTHLHQGVQARTMNILRAYLRDSNCAFVRLYNNRHSRTGRLFEKPPGCSQKETSKDKRSNEIYIFNNHVEKKLCSRAVEERWSLLAYALSDHPFSKELDFKKASKTLQKAIRLVDRRIKKLKGLEYTDLDKILPNLDVTEHEQFIDYVISQYAWIDFSAAESLFEDRESMILAIDSTTGNEFDINEEYSKLSDSPYQELVNFAAEEGVLNDIFGLDASPKANLIMNAYRNTSAKLYHLRKFFHEDFSLRH